MGWVHESITNFIAKSQTQRCLVLIDKKTIKSFPFSVPGVLLQPPSQFKKKIPGTHGTGVCV
jgi:hypothetical protein